MNNSETAVKLLKELESKNYTLSAMESITGGAFSATVVSIAGASRTFKGGIVAYSNEAKILNGIKEETLQNEGAISSACAKEMALLVSNRFESDVSIAFTGNAGPETQENKNVGLVFIAVRILDKLFSFEVQLKGDRERIIRECVDLGFKVLLEKINA